MKNNIQHAIDQLGIDAVRKSIGPIAIGHCTMHGSYAYDPEFEHDTHSCPICPAPLPDANGVTATKVSHYIDTNPIQDLANPNQLINPYGR